MTSHLGAQSVTQSRSGVARGSLVLLVVLAIGALAGEARAGTPFTYGDQPIHPACVHAVAMQEGDAFPVTTAVSLEGCANSERSRTPVRYEKDLIAFDDETVLGSGSFGYRVITQLDNGIYGLAIRRVYPDGQERVSLAAVKIVTRPMMLHGKIVNLQMLENLGELWVPGMELVSFRSVGNKVHFIAGVGPDRVERDVDFTRLGKMRK
jgi:hypothetical protein